MRVSTGTIVSHLGLNHHMVQSKRMLEYMKLASAEHASTRYRQVYYVLLPVTKTL